MNKYRSKSLISAIMLSVVVAGCAGLDTRLPDISAPDLAAETSRQETEALMVIQSNASTLLNVGWPVLVANADLCPKVGPALGIKMHSQKSYTKRLRPAARRVLGADEVQRVFHIADGGPAAAAGLRIGDVILGNDGEPAKIGGDDWDAMLDSGQLRVKRGKAELNVDIAPVQACDYNLRLSGSTAINAYADGRNITVTAAMMEFVESDQELALIVGHELAHNTMGHIRKIVGNFILSGGATRYTRPFESEADYVGMYYLVRAGYSPDGVEGFWQRLAKIAPKNISRAKTHPTFPDRFLRIAATRAEIEAKQEAGEALIPNYITGKNPSDS